MENLKIAIVGNSLGLRVRPPEKFPYNKNYGVILEELLQKRYPQKVVWVENLSMGRATILDTWANIDNILNAFPNYYIINLGVTDASTREIPLWYSNIINSRRPSWLRTLFMGFYLFVIKRIRPQLVLLRGKRPWISKRRFAKHFEKLIKFLKKETNAKIIIISINKAGKRIEKLLPGSSQNYLLYNKIIKNIALKHGALYLDSMSVVPEEYLPDGIHLSIEGNKIIAEEIFKLIEAEEQKITVN